MKHTILCLLFFAVMSLAVFAQTITFSVGDTVQTPDGRTGKIESLTGGVAKIKIEAGNEFAYFVIGDLKKLEITELQRPKSALSEAEQEKQRTIFKVEAAQYLRTVQLFEQFYRPDLTQLRGGIDDKVLQNGAVKLAELDALCKSKYPGITDAPETYRKLQLNYRFGEWCGMADDRTEVLNKAKLSRLGLSSGLLIDRWTDKISEAMRNQNGYVKDELQMLIYDRAAWEKKNIEDIRKSYAANGEKMPADSFAKLYQKADELKEKIERDAPTRSWKQPEYTDAAFEAIVRKAYPTSFPGVKVFKTGMTFGTWKAEDDTSLVGSGTDYKVYRTTKGAYRYKLGLALVKLPNQPFCQIRDFEFHQDKAGAGYTAPKLYLPLGNTGIFVKCP